MKVSNFTFKKSQKVFSFEKKNINSHFWLKKSSCNSSIICSLSSSRYNGNNCPLKFENTLPISGGFIYLAYSLPSLGPSSRSQQLYKNQRRRFLRQRETIRVTTLVTKNKTKGTLVHNAA